MKRRFLLVVTLCAALSLPAVAAAPPADAAPVVSSARWWRDYPDWNRTSAPTIADVNADKVNDVVFGSQDGWVRALDGRNGRDLPGWPQPASVVPGAATAIDASPSVADLDHDGVNEVIVGAGTNWPRANAQPGGIVVFWANGAVRCRRPVASFAGFTQVYSTPAIGDVDGNGTPDIVFGSFNHYIHAIDRNCNYLPGFPFFQHDTVWASPALYDVDNDSRAEIFIGGDSSPGGPEGWQGGDFRRLDWSPLGVAQPWRRSINNTFFSSAAIGDINGDGRREVITGAGQYWQDADGIADGKKVFAFHVDDGSNVPGWPSRPAAGPTRHRRSVTSTATAGHARSCRHRKTGGCGCGAATARACGSTRSTAARR